MYKSIKLEKLKSAGLIKTMHLLIVVFSLFSVNVSAQNHDKEVVDAAMQALDKWMNAFNSRDMDAWAATLNYPHVRIASGELVVYDSAKDFSSRPVFETLAKSGWDHSHWISREVNLSSPNKVHVSTVFQRFGKNNESIGMYQSLYILTREKGQWAIKARSSLAP